MEIKKGSILFMLTLFWALSLTVYVLGGVWENYKVNETKEAYQYGQNQAVLDLINVTATNNCDSVSVNYNKNEYSFIDVACIKDRSLLNKVPESGKMDVFK